MKELISVIVPVYNGEKLLPKCMEHLLGQTYGDFEIILVDDGSKDGSGAPCDGYAAADSRVRVIHQENQGVSRARNAGLDTATGAYVAFVDADDYVELDYLEHLHRNLVENDADIACCDDQEVIQADVAASQISLVAENRMIADKAAYFEDMVTAREAYWSTIWAKLFRRDLIGDTRFDGSFRYGEDHVFVFDLFAKAPTVHLDTYQGYYYVRNESSATLSRNANNVYRCENEMKMCAYKLRNLPEDAAYLKNGFLALYGHSIHNMARALALSGTPEERKTFRKDLLARIRECNRQGNLPIRTRVFLGLYQYLPGVYNALLTAKVNARENA